MSKNGYERLPDLPDAKLIISCKLTQQALEFEFDDCTKAIVFDGIGQACCEDRYLSCDENLDDFVGEQIINYEISEVQGTNDNEILCKEIMFCRIHTTSGTITLCSHVEHNGYYGGLDITIDGYIGPLKTYPKND